MTLSSLGASVVAAHERRARWLALRVVDDLIPRTEYEDKGELWVALFPAWRFAMRHGAHGSFEAQEVVLAAVRGADAEDGAVIYPQVATGDLLEVDGERWEVIERTVLESVGVVTLTLRRVEVRK